MEQIASRFDGQRVNAHMPYAGSYLGQGTIQKSYVCSRRNNLIFEVEGLEYVQPGVPVSFADRLRVEDGMISAQLDNVVSVAMLIDLIRSGFRGTAFFTAGEEAGRSWRFLVEWFQRYDLQTDQLIVLDTSPFPTLDEVRQQNVVLRNRDAAADFDGPLTELLVGYCEELGISYRFKDRYVEKLNLDREKPLSLGRTELGRVIHATGGKIRGTTLQLPSSAYHTTSETAEIESVSAMLRLLRHICQLPTQ